MSWKHATILLDDRLDFDGTYRAFDSADVDITGDSEVFFKLLISGKNKYRDGFGGNLTPAECKQFLDASHRNSLQVSPNSNIHRIDLMITGVWQSYYPH